MKLSISTLTCPAWTLNQILDNCAAAGVNGIDFRGIASEIDITRLPQFTTELPETMRLLGEKNIRLPCFNLSTTLLTPDRDRWQDFLDETLRYSKLAQVTLTKYLRVFGGAVPKELTRDQAISLGRERLREIVKIASGYECQILLETHDDWATSEEVLPLLEPFDPAEVAVLWDIEHPFRKGESPEDFVRKMAPLIKHIHIKDSLEDRRVPTLLGEGDLPIDASLAALKSIGFTGWYSLECEKRWLAAAPDPEESIPQFVQYMQARMN